MSEVEEVDGLVAQVLSATEIAINRGANHGVREGDDVSVWRVVEIKDPDTNASLGSVRREVVSLEVNFVEDEFSIAKVRVQASAWPSSMFGVQPKIFLGSKDDERVRVTEGDELTVFLDRDQDGTDSGAPDHNEVEGS